MNNFNNIDQVLAKAAEDRARIEQVLAPNRAIADLLGGNPTATAVHGYGGNRQSDAATGTPDCCNPCVIFSIAPLT